MPIIARFINFLLKPIGVRLIRTCNYNRLAEFFHNATKPVLIYENIIPDIDFIKVSFLKGMSTDTRLRARGVNTVLAKPLKEVIDIERFKNKRVLEIGPRFGFHSLWIDKNIQPEFFLMVDIPKKLTGIEHDWLAKIECPHEIYYADILKEKRLLEHPPFDLVFFTGVLYHNVEQIKMLNLLWRVTHPKGMMLLQSTAHNSSESLLRFSWKPGQPGGYCYPSPKALLTMLVMTGWNNFCVFPEYRPRSSMILLTCEKENSIPISVSGVPFGGSNI